MNRIEKAFDRLLTTNGEIKSRIENVSYEINIADTKATCYCYCLKTTANNNLRLEDLVEFIDTRIVDYAIPKKEIDEASPQLC
jgi:hypothetical protein